MWKESREEAELASKRKCQDDEYLTEKAMMNLEVRSNDCCQVSEMANEDVREGQEQKEQMWLQEQKQLVQQPLFRHQDPQNHAKWSNYQNCAAWLEQSRCLESAVLSVEEWEKSLNMPSMEEMEIGEEIMTMRREKLECWEGSWWAKVPCLQDGEEEELSVFENWANKKHQVSQREEEREVSWQIWSISLPKMVMKLLPEWNLDPESLLQWNHEDYCLQIYQQTHNDQKND